MGSGSPSIVIAWLALVSGCSDGGTGAPAPDVLPDPIDAAPDAAAPPPCPVTAPCVLFYGPVVFNADPTPFDPTVYNPFESPHLPEGTVITIADEAKWRSMTTAEFARFNLIIIGDNIDWHPRAEYLQAAFETRAVWNPAITGRIVVQGIDAGFHTSHSMNVDAARTYVRTTMAWLTSGSGTALYVSSIARDYDYLDGLGTWRSAYDEGEAVTIVDAAHPIFAGSTAESLSNWYITYHRTTDQHPAQLRVAATAASGKPVILVRD